MAGPNPHDQKQSERKHGAQWIFKHAEKQLRDVFTMGVVPVTDIV